jgi:hypothetical protein
LLSPGAQFGALPATVQNTVRAEAGTAEIADVRTLHSDGQTVYRIDFLDAKTFPPLYVRRDGSVLDPNLRVAVGAANDSGGAMTGSVVSGVPYSALPEEVVAVLRERAPRSQIASIDRETWGDRIVYVINFKDEVRYPKLYMMADGTVLKEGPR